MATDQSFKAGPLVLYSSCGYFLVVTLCSLIEKLRSDISGNTFNVYLQRNGLIVRGGGYLMQGLRHNGHYRFNIKGIYPNQRYLHSLLPVIINEQNKIPESQYPIPTPQSNQQNNVNNYKKKCNQFGLKSPNISTNAYIDTVKARQLYHESGGKSPLWPLGGTHNLQWKHGRATSTSILRLILALKYHLKIPSPESVPLPHRSPTIVDVQVHSCFPTTTYFSRNYF